MKLSFALIVVLGLVAISNALPTKNRMAYYKESGRYSAKPVITHARLIESGDSTIGGEINLKENDLNADIQSDNEIPLVHPVNVERAAVGGEKFLSEKDVKIPIVHSTGTSAVEEPSIDVLVNAETPLEKRTHGIAAKKPIEVAVESEDPAQSHYGNNDRRPVQDADAVEIEGIPIDSQKGLHGTAVRRPAARARSIQPLPAGTFFSLNLNGVNGGAIGIANSLSTNTDGSAASHATAYADPDADASHTEDRPVKHY